MLPVLSPRLFGWTNGIQHFPPSLSLSVSLCLPLCLSLVTRPSFIRPSAPPLSSSVFVVRRPLFTWAHSAFFSPFAIPISHFRSRSFPNSQFQSPIAIHLFPSKQFSSPYLYKPHPPCPTLLFFFLCSMSVSLDPSLSLFHSLFHPCFLSIRIHSLVYLPFCVRLFLPPFPSRSPSSPLFFSCLCGALCAHRLALRAAPRRAALPKGSLQRDRVPLGARACVHSFSFCFPSPHPASGPPSATPGLLALPSLFLSPPSSSCSVRAGLLTNLLSRLRAVTSV